MVSFAHSPIRPSASTASFFCTGLLHWRPPENRFVVFHRSSPFGYVRELPDIEPCIDRYRERFGAPWHEDDNQVIFRLPGNSGHDYEDDRVMTIMMTRVTTSEATIQAAFDCPGSQDQQGKTGQRQSNGRLQQDARAIMSRLAVPTRYRRRVRRISGSLESGRRSWLRGNGGR